MSLASMMTALAFSLAMLVACGQQPTTRPVMALRFAPDPNACPGAALPLPLRFRIDPTAPEQVIAVTREGRAVLVWWAPGFVADVVGDPVVRDPDGTVVARDGELLETPLLHGHTVCATSDAIYVLLT